ncbi:hypothetical protein XA68_16299 [Ophiocordyceps unilateralis]|uniref:Diphthamide biosynthesis protein 4 n=1 Tax=Ophiocordyceps unilateralis TaxID=268505 RepID=A0A2A9PLK9_OPHUN|nr:hypothetical protein XA68_16299 [Ophiocordyceps unilateralis]
MATSLRNSVATISHYDVLGLSPALLDAVAQDASPLIKQAYRRALLRNHPDKTGGARQSSLVSSSSFFSSSSSSSNSSSSSSSSPRSAAAPARAIRQPPPTYTVDQISQAFAVLASPSRRAEYDVSLRLAAARPEPGPARFQTGVENVDLDDLSFDDEGDRWYRFCRCGNERGYSFDEADLADAADEGLLMVGCLDCSLWLRVHFAAVDEGEELEIT